MNKKMHTLSAADEERVLRGRAAMSREYQSTDAPAAVAKGLAAYATKLRNQRRTAAITNHPFTNVCEQTQNPLAFAHKHLHELEPELGYLATVMWSCPACNNSGLISCKTTEERLL